MCVCLCLFRDYRNYIKAGVSNPTLNWHTDPVGVTYPALSTTLSICILESNISSGSTGRTLRRSWLYVCKLGYLAKLVLPLNLAVTNYNCNYQDSDSNTPCNHSKAMINKTVTVTQVDYSCSRIQFQLNKVKKI